jgi:hypothetical protein
VQQRSAEGAAVFLHPPRWAPAVLRSRVITPLVVARAVRVRECPGRRAERHQRSTQARLSRTGPHVQCTVPGVPEIGQRSWRLQLQGPAPHAGMQDAGAGGASMRYAQQHQPAASYRSICSSSAAAQQRRRQARACTHCQSLPTALCKLCVVLYRRIRPYCLSAAAAVSVCTAECMYTSVRFVIERVYVRARTVY